MISNHDVVAGRLAERTDRSGGPDACWPWVGAKARREPRMWLDGKGRQARIVQWELVNGPLPKGRTVTMKCKLRACLNPSHMKLRARLDDTARFWEKVEKSDGCWTWKGSIGVNSLGYGVFHIGDHSSVIAHRYSWELHFGKIEGHDPTDPTKEINVCHHCDNPKCVRPDHLFLGTDKDNHDDMMRKGRHAHGPSLSEAIRKSAEARRNMQRLAAKAMGVSDE